VGEEKNDKTAEKNTLILMAASLLYTCKEIKIHST
jgi:hypothetical protein